MRQRAYDYDHTYETAIFEKTSFSTHILTLNPLIKSQLTRGVQPGSGFFQVPLAICIMLRKTGFCTKPEIIDYKVGQSSSFALLRIKSDHWIGCSAG